ncbi:MAG: isoaspartyl peptidase/L-asparaginase [Deltaproteobacteria bacterium]|nr:isoaspartyl peptidase/L-asparaginase [Deltaproteobacteria bacterium]
MRFPFSPAVVTHGGAANDPANRDACEAANDAALSVLRAGGSALDAAVAAVVVLEDDPRLNAGTGATLRLDGSVQLDACVMDARGFGAVAAVDDVLNPVRLARAVYDLPHLLLAGDGATAVARQLGLPIAAPITEAQRLKHAQRIARLGATSGADAGWAAMWQGVDERFWKKTSELGGACDTVGAVVRDARGELAAAGSTGGLWCSLRGRVGDIAIPGAGVFVGPLGAVACTGVGELIWREMLSQRVHDRLGDGRGAQAVVDDVVAGFREREPGFDVGVIAVGLTSMGGAVTGAMPWACRSER